MNPKKDVSLGLSQFQVEVWGADGSLRATHPFPPQNPSQTYHTDGEAINAFVQFHGQQAYEELHVKNLQNRDVLCQFVTIEGTKYLFVRKSLTKWPEKDPTKV